MNMRIKWTLAPLTVGLLYGCGGSDVKIARYSAELFEPASPTTVTDIASNGSAEVVIGQVSGLAFAIPTVPRGVGFPGLLSPSEDIVAGVNASGTIVGYDSSSTPGQPALTGTTSGWAANDFGLTLTTEYLRALAVSPNGTIGFMRFPATGAATVFRRVGTSNTILTNFTDFKPSVITEVNDDGKMCGFGFVATDTHAFMSSGNALVDLGVGTARSVNASGIVVGKNEINRPYRTLNSSSTQRAALPLLPGFTQGEALDVNDAGIIVGWQSESESSPKVPVAWYENGALVDLRLRVDTLPANVDLHEAVAVTNDGTILIQGRRTTGGLEPVGVILRLSN